MARATAAALVLAGTAVGCGADGAGDAGGGRIRVEAGLYPLQWLAEQVGGDDVEVASLTPPGAEPHDLELTPKEVARVQDAGLVLLVHGLQPNLDEAAADGGERTFDLADATELDLEAGEEGHDHEGEDHEGQGEHAEEGHEHEGADPHVWLDPVKLGEAAEALGERFAAIDPDRAAAYRERAATTVELLGGIDEDFRTGLADCASTDLVTSHAAFGYLAHRYGLEQLGITGISPEAEPSPKRLAEVASFVEEHDVRTIYFEQLVPDDLARTVARETGATTAVLDPLEGLTDESAGDDYPSVMAANLQALVAGQGCS